MRCVACNIMLKTGKEFDYGYCQKCLKLVRFYENDDGILEDEDEDYSTYIDNGPSDG